MNFTCEKKCHLYTILANLKCPGCFGAEVSVDKEGGCDCKLTINPKGMRRWD